MLKTKEDLANFIQNDDFMMTALRTAKSLNLSDWFIGAGFVRDTAWNIQHGFEVDYRLRDLDLGYYDAANQSVENDELISNKLRGILNVNWEIVNQAYAHKYNKVPPYKSAMDGLSHWVDTATAVGVTLDENDKVIIIDPWGVSDLLDLKLRLVPTHKGSLYYEHIFSDRIRKKKWLERWPKLTIISD